MAMTLEDDWRSGRIVPSNWFRAVTSFSDLQSFPCLKEVTIDVTVRRQWTSAGERLLSDERLVKDLSNLPFDSLDLHFKLTLSARLGL